MAIHDFNAQRLYVDQPLAAGCEIVCDRQQSNYLKNVMRMKPGDQLLVFNGRDGEWRVAIDQLSKRAVMLGAIEQMREQTYGPDIHYLFAPLKRARLDYMVQKATELGVAVLHPVLTRRTVAGRVNLDRMRANVIEAAEQCGIVHLPQVAEPAQLSRVLDGWDEGRRLIFCDEAADETSVNEPGIVGDDVADEVAHTGPVAALSALKPGPLAVLIGPEGGFDPGERDLLISNPFVTRISLGPRIMRADTAGVAALALVNAVLGDWR